jgi:signal peptidase II
LLDLCVVSEWLLPAGLILSLDQLSKGLALARLGERPHWRAGRGARVRRVGHGRIGLGLIRDRRALLLLWIVAVIGTNLLIHNAEAFEGQVARAGLGAALGGATGNLIDTLWRGAVVDFIDLPIWPSFNIADAAITLGTAVALGAAIGSAPG